LKTRRGKALRIRVFSSRGFSKGWPERGEKIALQRTILLLPFLLKKRKKKRKCLTIADTMVKGE